ncbi:phosphatidylinositol-specific phospholipase C/glycerophosphodiester phosphodiesterase family protein [Rhodopirellula sp. MGV]|uniref:phosphatidylinositol-specific phospholipase C/glycerophosphodiester phosphodiesterase family protein n=1 Tax=Rhodopirellula sp. MGV TaxID=2023130 RepID=UPI000B9695E3|nr:phosphatidylinositol-specific phospholipase C/glycerophosphodiester phosphodiesterase family protein [Rhodopirellula sp. MGV]OYP36147.1 hypothetical protein CGZ80_09805 [Rhodopirellula sp. MGV]PNY36606.1 hypothetical protein C2E31_12200 [Rhodopirellula baltica]
MPRFFSPVAIAFAVLATILVSNVAHAASPLPHAHAHNDYWHTQPLIDALDHGFSSVEADVFFTGEKLLVGHDLFELRSQRTLQSLYLDPLRERVKQNGGSVYKDGPRFMLMIDFKSDGEQTFKALEAVLANYREMLCRVESGKLIDGPIQIVVSGNRPIETMKETENRLCFVDGRVENLTGKSYDKNLMPVVSDRWTKYFQWTGKGSMPENEKKQLRQFVDAAHANGQRVRFWATPEKDAVWQALLDADVDHINSDQLERLEEFLRNGK